MWCVGLVARVYGLEMFDLCCSPTVADTKNLIEARTLLFGLLVAYDCAPAKIVRAWGWSEVAVAEAFRDADPRLPRICADRSAWTEILEALRVGRLTSEAGDIDFTGISRDRKIERLRARLDERRGGRKLMGNAHFVAWFSRNKLYGHSADILHTNMYLLPDFRGRAAVPDNDGFLKEAFEIFARPVPWGEREIVYLVEKYALALQFNRLERQGFETDGRVVLMCGRSSASHRPSAHCLVFRTVAEADAFCERIPQSGRRSTAYHIQSA
jgi:hypothetical protein